MRWGHPETGKVVLFCSDAVLAALSIIASLRLAHPVQVSLEREIFADITFTLIFLSFHYIFDLYQVTGNGKTALIYRFLGACCCDMLVASTLFFIYPLAAYTRRNIIFAVLLACATSYALTVAISDKSGDIRQSPAGSDPRHCRRCAGDRDGPAPWTIPGYELVGYLGNQSWTEEATGSSLSRYWRVRWGAKRRVREGGRWPLRRRRAAPTWILRNRRPQSCPQSSTGQ